jgi:hypothetical protein
MVCLSIDQHFQGQGVHTRTIAKTQSGIESLIDF